MGVWNVPKRRNLYYRGKILCCRKSYNKKIIQNEIEIGTEIHSDEWLAYKTLETKEYIHKTVNHSKFFVDPINSAHTQRIESLWRGLKLRILKKMHGTSPSLLSSYLAEQWWRLRNSNDDIFECFLRDVKLYCI
ncbi:DDE Tnp IS1595 domain-containing protein [Aphis craccivora]|uniref:DDE Tnp IS1595 domain-containing protein n=1 Tax=Aphis craccivora TaxID=307492 RepID=A0A6G0W048_APHCR|nr:DDE Tnp IS1595 domain-containing protein [Aphis craccivora]